MIRKYDLDLYPMSLYIGIISDEDDSSLEKREKVVNDICQKLIDKYETGDKE